MNREDDLNLIKKHVTNRNLIKHMLAVEAVMGALAKRFNQDEASWRRAGLLHDLDYDLTVNDFAQHGFKTAEILKELEPDFSTELIQAIKAHAGHAERTSLMDKALYATDPVTGLIVAAALIHPAKKQRLRALTPEFILNRYKEKLFARGANREQIQACQELGLSLEEFISLALEAMQAIELELGL